MRHAQCGHVWSRGLLRVERSLQPPRRRMPPPRSAATSGTAPATFGQLRGPEPATRTRSLRHRRREPCLPVCACGTVGPFLPGRNEDGQLGDELVPRTVPVRCPPPRRRGGRRHGRAPHLRRAQRRHGGVLGRRRHRSAGRRRRRRSAGAAPVAGVSGATGVVAGAGFSCALLADRTAVCWGDDSDGGIGDGGPSTIPRPPTPIPGLGRAGAGGPWQHACALLTDNGRLLGEQHQRPAR